MTAATSSNKTNYFGTRYFTGITENKRVLIVNLVLNILGLPLLTVLTLICLKATEFEDYFRYSRITDACEPFMFVSIIMISIALFLGLAIALFSYNYLYRKTIVDMHYSLPLSNFQRFFADYLSGLSVYMVPSLISIVLSGIIYAIGRIFVDVKDFESELFPMFWYCVAIVLATMILYYSVSVFAITFCGNTFEAIFSIFGYIGMVPAVIACFWLTIVSSSSFGPVFESIGYNPLFTASNPIGSFVFFLNFFDLYQNNPDSKFITSMLAHWFIAVIIFSALYTFGAFLLYKFRKAEDVSKPYVYKSYFYIVMTMAVFSVISVLRALGVSPVPGILVCGVMWFIMEVVTRRGFKRFWTVIAGYTVAVIVVLAVSFSCTWTNGFGILYSVPGAASIEAVEFNTETFPSYENIVIYDRDFINSAVEFNKKVVDMQKHPDDHFSSVDNNGQPFLYDMETIDLTFYSFTGNAVRKSYNVPSYMLGDMYKNLIFTGDFKEYLLRDLMRVLPMDYDNDTELQTIYVSDKFDINSVPISISEAESLKLETAIRTDLSKLTKADLERMDDVAYLINDFRIYSFYDETISCLKNLFRRNGYLLPEVSVRPAEYDQLEIAIDPNIIFNYYDYYHNNRGFSTDYWYYDEEMLKDYEASFDRISYYSCNCTVAHSNYTIDFSTPGGIELMSRFSPCIYDEKPIAIMKYGSRCYFLTDKGDNRQLLEKYAIKVFGQYDDEPLYH